MTGAYSGDRWKSARAAALERDNHRCQKCGDEWNIHAHHIIPVREFESEQDAHYPENLVALCQYCHPTEEGKPRWPESGGIETDAGVSHIANLLALRTVSRSATGEAAPEILAKRLFTHPDICACCFKWFTSREPQLRNPFEDYHRTLYRIVVEGQEIADASRETLPKEFTFCNDCKGRQRLTRSTKTEEKMAVDNLCTLLLTFGFNRSYSASADFDVLESVFVDTTINGTSIETRRYAFRIQRAFSMAFGRSRRSDDLGYKLNIIFGHASSEYRDGITDDDDDGATDFPDWYRGGLNRPYSE